MKNGELVKVSGSHPPAQEGKYTALVQLQLGLCKLLLGPPKIVEDSEGIYGLAETVLYVIACSSITSKSVA